jgi:hypothetical protein
MKTINKLNAYDTNCHFVLNENYEVVPREDYVKMIKTSLKITSQVAMLGVTFLTIITIGGIL